MYRILVTALNKYCITYYTLLVKCKVQLEIMHFFLHYIHYSYLNQMQTLCFDIKISD